MTVASFRKLSERKGILKLSVHALEQKMIKQKSIKSYDRLQAVGDKRKREISQELLNEVEALLLKELEELSALLKTK